MADQKKVRPTNGNKKHGRMRSISVPRTTLEVKQYHFSGLTIQRSIINQHRLRRRDIINNESNECSNTSNVYSPHTKTENNKLFCRQKSKLIKKFQKYSKKIEHKFRKKYDRNHHKTRQNTNKYLQNHNIKDFDNFSKSTDTEKKAESEKKSEIPLKTADVCYDFQNHGNCKRGDGCRYKHVLASKSLCLDWMNGHCPRGDGCRFAHRYGTDIIQPKINKITKYKKIQTLPIPQLIPQLIPRAQFASGTTLLIPSTKIVQSALPKIIPSGNRLNINTCTRAPFAVIVRNTHAHTKEINRVRIVNNNMYLPHSASQIPHYNTQTHRHRHRHYPSHIIHPYMPGAHAPNRNEEGDNMPLDDEEFDFEKLGNEIQSNIQREEAKKLQFYKSRVHAPTQWYRQSHIYPPPPPPAPAPPPAAVHNNYKYKYKPNSYFYHSERNNNYNNKYIRKNHNHVIRSQK